MKRSPPAPPRPDRLRRPGRSFGWLDARLVKDHWLARLGPDAIAVAAFLAIVADAQGVSYWGRSRIAVALSIDRARITKALDRLREMDLVAFRPWKPGDGDGVWQLLPLPEDP